MVGDVVVQTIVILMKDFLLMVDVKDALNTPHDL